MISGNISEGLLAVAGLLGEHGEGNAEARAQDVRRA